MNNLVSIITPSFNTAKYIGKTIESVQNQTYVNWEMIIVDDCSTDNTDDVVKSYLDDRRIHYIKNKENKGAALCRNLALSTAKGRWIAFLDSDDLWHMEKLEKQIRFMEEKRASFSYTCYQEIDESGALLGNLISGPKRITKAGMHMYCFPGCLTVMYDRNVLGLLQINDIKKNNDYAMWLKLCSLSDCMLLNENLAMYRRREGSISRHGIMTMISWHYKLWHEAQEKNIVTSMFYTVANLVFGTWKKVRYIKRDIYEIRQGDVGNGERISSI